jgi:membrane protease YdiL (CAAX protease family)
MTIRESASVAGNESIATNRKLLWSGVLFGLVYPTIITWGYFVLAGTYSTGVQQSVYLVVKIFQFAFPLLWVWLVLREPLRTGRATVQGLALGAIFSIAVIGAGWMLFDFRLRDMPIFEDATTLIQEKVAGFGVDSVWKYAVLAAFYSLFHSLLEEYYWRWFVFRQMRRLTPASVAIVVSALGFMSHHVIVLNVFFKEAPALVWLLSSAVALGGVFWAWLYERTGSLLGPWLSHLLIDAGIFWIGYDLLRETIVR